MDLWILALNDGECLKANTCLSKEDTAHCHCWWDLEKPCCYCGWSGVFRWIIRDITQKGD